MKKLTHYTLCFLAPMVLWAQAEPLTSVEIDLSDVIVVEDAATSESPETATVEVVEIPEGTEVSAIEVVEIPDTLIEGASIDLESPSIPEVTESLPTDTEIVLELPGQEAAAPGEASLASEETISVDFPDEDVRTILRNVADLFELNLVIPDTLQGRTSIKLRNITWRQAFEVVLEPLGYTYIEDRNIIRIKSIEELTTEPVDTRVFVANYARAEDLQGSIAPLVDTAAGGRIQVDTRSNALVITERPSRMNKIQEIIERLDKATDQVMIESKFIEVRRTDGKDLGVDWSSLGGESGGVGIGVSEAISAVTDEGTSFIAEEVQGALGLPATATDSANNITRNALDTAVFNSSSFGIVLKALEEANDTELISNPTVVTMDNEKAVIKISREFPQPDFTFNAETGQRQFNGLGEPIDVGITLEVTPSVNAAGFINLDIFPEVSSTSEDRIIENTAFPIRDVRTARTRITIKDGYTLALGGLVSTEMSKSGNSVPFLGSLPGVGRLFSSESESKTETNLIIFITAKTLNPDGTNYKDTIDPRLLHSMQITPSELPGYQISEERRKRLQEIADLRNEDKLQAAEKAEEEYINKLKLK
jgi:type IV pilus assembly protein PilQ